MAITSSACKGAEKQVCLHTANFKLVRVLKSGFCEVTCHQ